jgi:DNA-binding transcriptional regulator WhiA
VTAVERPGRDLVAAVRAELAAIEPARRCCRLAERAGLGSAASGRARTPAVGRLAVRLAEAPGSDPPAAFDWPTAAGHCRIAWLRGVFLSRGSLSLAAGRTHLELVVPPAELAPLSAQLAEMGLPAASRLRRGRGVLTWKSSDTVVALLRRLGGTAATLELESRFVARTLRGHLNRVVNAEHANLARSVASARRQLEHIETLRGSGQWARLPRSVRAVAEARRRAPEATYSELAAQLDTSRALVQRAFETLAERALAAGDGGPG